MNIKDKAHIQTTISPNIVIEDIILSTYFCPNQYFCSRMIFFFVICNVMLLLSSVINSQHRSAPSTPVTVSRLCLILIGCRWRWVNRTICCGICLGYYKSPYPIEENLIYVFSPFMKKIKNKKKGFEDFFLCSMIMHVFNDTFQILFSVYFMIHRNKISSHVQPEALNFLYSNCSYKTSKSLKSHIVLQSWIIIPSEMYRGRQVVLLKCKMPNSSYKFLLQIHWKSNTEFAEPLLIHVLLGGWVGGG